MYRLFPVRPLLAAAAIVAAGALSVVSGHAPAPVAEAQTPHGVTILAPALPADPGTDATFILVVNGADAANALVTLDVEGGEIMQQLGLSESEPGLATSTVWVRRDSPGHATLTATTSGGSASASAAFGQGAAVQVALFVDGGDDDAARTWLFEIVDGVGNVVSELVTATSGDSPTSTITSDVLPAGSYTVRAADDSTLTSACGGGSFYKYVVPATGAAAVTLGASGTVVVEFVITPCPLSSSPSEVPAVTTPGATPTQLVAGARTTATAATTPLAPATGAGTASAGSSAFSWLVVGVLLVTAGASGWAVTRRRPVSAR